MKVRSASLFLLLLTSAGVVQPSAFAEIRVFTSASGKTLRGELLEVNGGSVTIRKEDGRIFTLKSDTFAAGDQLYFKQQASLPPASSSVAKKGISPKLSSKDFRELPFCATEPKTKFNPKDKEIFDELKVTTSDRIRIHGKKQNDAGKVKGNILYHLGKVALFPVGERSGTLVAKQPTEDGVRRHFAVLETANGLISEEIALGDGKTYTWMLTNDGENTVLTINEGSQAIGKVSGPAASITSSGFAATVRWVGNEADLVVTFDDNQK